MSHNATSTHRSTQSALDGKFPSYMELIQREGKNHPRYWMAQRLTEIINDLPKMPDITKMLFDDAHATVAELEGKGILAKDLTEKQKCAIFLLAGFLKYEDGRFISIRPVGIADNGNGGYFVSIAPEEKP